MSPWRPVLSSTERLIPPAPHTPTPMPATPKIDPTWTVTETTVRVPGTTDVFDIFGIDPWDAGNVSVAEAARRAGVALPGLLEALGEAGRVNAVVAEVHRVIAELTGEVELVPALC